MSASEDVRLDGYDTDPVDHSLRSIAPRFYHSSSPRGCTLLQSTPAGHGTRLDGLGITPIGSRSLQLSRPRSASERVYTPGDSDLSD